jgi:hypothetical protein
LIKKPKNLPFKSVDVNNPEKGTVRVFAARLILLELADSEYSL